jgi:hypothetical protein
VYEDEPLWQVIVLRVLQFYAGTLAAGIALMEYFKW